jgi:putative DNA primase/helicase
MAATMQGTAATRLLDKLDKVKANGANQWIARCPAHEDGNPSLSVKAVDGRALVYCFAGCQPADIVAAIDMRMLDLFDSPKELEYRYDNGRIAKRFYKPDGTKGFSQSNTEHAPELYKLAKVGAAVSSGLDVYLCEGEEDVRALESLGVCATSAPQGAGNWSKADYGPLVGSCDVWVVADLDKAGNDRALGLSEHLKQIGVKVAGVLTAKVGNDAADHVAAGYGLADLMPLPETAIEPSPAAVVLPRGIDWEDHGLRSHQRIAARLARYGRGHALYINGAGWHVWDRTRWAPDARNTNVNKLLTDLLKISWSESISDPDLASDVRASMTATGSSGVLALASTQLFAAEVDSDPWLLNCQNGTLDLRNLTLRPHDPADLITKITGAAYDPAATSDTWDRFLVSSLPNADIRAFLQRFAGMSLVGRVLEHVLVIATGSGRNGKGIMSGALSRSLGDYAVTASNDLLIAGRYGHKSAGELASQMVLRGARLAVMSELNKGDKLDESTMKTLTGGDSITAKLMGQNFVEFRPSHTFFMLTNDLPTIDATAKAAWARLRVVPFDVSFEGREDTTLEEKLEREVNAVLTWAVEGLRAYHSEGLAAPLAVTTRTDEYRADNDPLRRFIDEDCIKHRAASVMKAVFSSEYAKWAMENREEILSPRAIGTQMKQIAGITESNSGARTWVGIGMKRDEEK